MIELFSICEPQSLHVETAGVITIEVFSMIIVTAEAFVSLNAFRISVGNTTLPSSSIFLIVGIIVVFFP